MARPDLAVMMFDLAVSGVVRNAIRIAGAAEQAGMRVELWIARDGGEMRSQVPQDVKVRTFGATVAEGYSRAQRKGAALATVPALASALAEHRPRIACSAGNHFHETAARARRAAGDPSGSRLIGRVSNALPRFSWHPALLPPSLWKRIAARRRLSAMDRLIAVSSGLADDLKHQLLIPSGKIVVIPNGIDLADAELRATDTLDHPWFRPEQPPVVLGVGRLVPQKNFGALIRAFASARRSMPMRLLLLGEGAERGKLERLASKLGVADAVRFEGYVDNPMPYYSRSALFVLPSRWEGMSNALLEAMAAGCPVLATRCPGSVEVLGDGLKHRLVSIGDETSLSDQMVTVLRNPDSAARLRQQVAKFDLRRTLLTYVELFESELRR